MSQFSSSVLTTPKEEVLHLLGRSFGLLFVITLVATQVYAAGECAIKQYAELPITIAEARPLITGTMNGESARFLVDSTVPYSIISLENTLKWRLKMDQRPSEITEYFSAPAHHIPYCQPKQLNDLVSNRNAKQLRPESYYRSTSQMSMLTSVA